MSRCRYVKACCSFIKKKKKKEFYHLSSTSLVVVAGFPLRVCFSLTVSPLPDTLCMIRHRLTWSISWRPSLTTRRPSGEGDRFWSWAKNKDRRRLLVVNVHPLQRCGKRHDALPRSSQQPLETSLVTLFLFQHMLYLADFLRNYLDTVIPTPGSLSRHRS